jgi:hypothetical protein
MYTRTVTHSHTRSTMIVSGEAPAGHVKVPVKKRALIARIDRRLQSEAGSGSDYGTIRATRGERAQSDLGDYYVLNVGGNYVMKPHVDPEAMGRKMGIPRPWEEVRSCRMNSTVEKRGCT